MTFAELKAHNFASMALHGLDEVKIRLHKCDICGKIEPWGEGWSHYGSLASEEFGHVLKFCSDKCKSGVDTGKLWKKKFGCAENARQYTRGY